VQGSIEKSSIEGRGSIKDQHKQVNFLLNLNRNRKSSGHNRVTKAVRIQDSLKPDAEKDSYVGQDGQRKEQGSEGS